MYSHLSVYIANSALYKSCLSYCSDVHKAVIFGSIVLQKYALRKSVSRKYRFRKDHNSYCPQFFEHPLVSIETYIKLCCKYPEMFPRFV